MRNLFKNCLAAMTAAAVASAAVSGCCRKAPEPRQMTLDEAVEFILAATTNQAALSGVEADEWDDGDASPARRLPTAEDARTNLVARFTIQLKENAVAMAELTRRREEALAAAVEANQELADARSAMIVARKRYDDLVKADPSIQAIEVEMAQLRRVRGALLQQREKFEGKSAPISGAKKESK